MCVDDLTFDLISDNYVRSQGTAFVFLIHSFMESDERANQHFLVGYVT